MSKLHDYSLVEVQLKSYSLHACVHDWSLEFLNRIFDDKLYRLAVHSVGQSVQWEIDYRTLDGLTDFNRTSDVRLTNIRLLDITNPWEKPNEE